jgi:beta-glucosidase
LLPAAQAAVPTYLDPAVDPESRIDSLLLAMTLDEKIDALGTNPSVPRLGLRLSGHIEGLHGVALGGPGKWGRFKDQSGVEQNVPVPTTQFPQAAGLAESFDVALLRRVANIESEEARYAYQNEKYHRGGLVVRAPNVDLARDPRWGRTEESYGEDPFLNGTLASAFVQGLQGDDPRYWRAAALLKHFFANSNEDRREYTSSNFDEALMRDYYSVPFRMAIVDAGARAFMSSYNSWNDVPMEINPILKAMPVAEWGQNGIICTDGGAMKQLKTTHAAVASFEAAAAASLRAGINQFLDDHRQPVRDALRQGLITEGQINESLRGVYRVMLHLGLLDPPEAVPYAGLGAGDEPWLKESRHMAVREVTRESIVLLKNQRAALPLDPRSLQRVAVIGRFADQVLLDLYSGTPPYTVSALEGIRRALPEASVQFARDESDGALRLAKEADVAIVVVGNHPLCDAQWMQCPSPSEGKEAVDRKALTLPQETLVRRVHAVNPRTILVLTASFPYAINWSQAHLPAIVLMTHNSQESGTGLADVLLGTYNPAGRLVQTWPRTLAQLPPMLDYDIRHGRTYMYFKGAPLYPFGHGLSYTHFRYRNLSAPDASAGAFMARLTVKNDGPRDGDEVVQLYVSHPDLSAAPRLALRGFERIHLSAGEERDVAFRISPQALAHWDAARHRFVSPKGALRLSVGASSADIRLRHVLQITDELAFEANLSAD